MSRVAKYPVKLPNGVEVKFDGDQLTVKGGQGSLSMTVHPDVVIGQEEGQLTFTPSETAKSWAMVGTSRALVQNMVTGVSEGFTKSLEINGVGYRAQASGKTLNLTLGFSHPVEYTLPEGVTAETPKNTTIVLKSANKQQLGQVAAEIRAFRPPEPYKGKGIRYGDEQVRRKEAKKK
ncbi:50S ribosomal protein L6 [Halomonas sp. McH1-25]|uniref:50S ribosomal protein L6 n=1 Tax=unclassified Halomonas TaxID=2609666 RepID=UPI001EF53D7B|nr:MULTISPECIES: 50S ribosomal protein L6 [unclassified Halomonas]MCG7601347.1 50S ribosomal protein L6 [Halomonas sp. McH1-25]MCP1343491.1 50S ribosomal protein L6 [Halomonas sp. FL8]MCP1361178.1 50S ribosomal protein L6 [Halomonas sp. BBD45]MCP1364517.1 50S ribosomal protein L6 [Halomonas sp. BBD48]